MLLNVVTLFILLSRDHISRDRISSTNYFHSVIVVVVKNLKPDSLGSQPCRSIPPFSTSSSSTILSNESCPLQKIPSNLTSSTSLMVIETFVDSYRQTPVE